MPSSESGRRLRVLIAKPGLDGHDVGARVVARALRDAGMEVIYTGIRISPLEIAVSAIEEDVDAIGLSILSGSHVELVGRVIALLRKNRAGDIPVLVGGIIPRGDILKLKRLGVAGVFPAGASTKDIVNFVLGNIGGSLHERRGSSKPR